jgi:hypothetical protein
MQKGDALSICARFGAGDHTVAFGGESFDLSVKVVDSKGQMMQTSASLF